MVGVTVVMPARTLVHVLVPRHTLEHRDGVHTKKNPVMGIPTVEEVTQIVEEHHAIATHTDPTRDLELVHARLTVALQEDSALVDVLQVTNVAVRVITGVEDPGLGVTRFIRVVQGVDLIRLLVRGLGRVHGLGRTRLTQDIRIVGVGLGLGA